MRKEADKSVQNQIRKIRARWIRDQLIGFGIQRAHHWGWPNIYTFTKSLGESLLERASGLPSALPGHRSSSLQ